VGHSLAYNFVHQRNSNKVVVNVADQYALDNNCGFNLANFKARFIRQYFEDVVTDYERSFLGSFSAALIEHFLPESGCDLYFSMSKFANHMGFSLSQNKPEMLNDLAETDAENTLDSLAEGGRPLLTQRERQ
jgi:hypothetical protein